MSREDFLAAQDQLRQKAEAFFAAVDADLEYLLGLYDADGAAPPPASLPVRTTVTLRLRAAYTTAAGTLAYMPVGTVVEATEGVAAGVSPDTLFLAPGAAIRLTGDDLVGREIWLKVTYEGTEGWACAYYGPEDAWYLEDATETPEPDPEPEPEPTPLTPSIIGSYILRFGAQVQVDDIIRSQMRFLVADLADNEDAAVFALRQILDALPNIRIVLRYTGHKWWDPNGGEVKLEDLWLQGQRGAQIWYTLIKPLLDRLNLSADERQQVAVMGPNEFGDRSDLPANSLARKNVMLLQDEHEQERMRLLAGDGYLAAIHSWPEGCPEEAELVYQRDSLTMAYYGGHWVGMHAYFEDHNGPHGFTDPGDYFLYRYRRFRQIFAQWGIDPLFFIGETGFTTAKDGGVGYLDPEHGITMDWYMNLLFEIEKGWQADGILGAAVFARSPWPPFELSDTGVAPHNQVFHDRLAERNT